MALNKFCVNSIIFNRQTLSSILFQSRNNFIRLNSTQHAGRTKRLSPLRMALYGIGIGTVIGSSYAGFSYYNMEKKKNAGKILNNDPKPFIIDNKPDVKPTRQIYNPDDKSGLEIILFQYQTCPFCCKVRSFLDFTGLSYSVVEVDAVLRQSIKWSPYKKVPIVLVKTKDDKYLQLNDSSMIISTISSYLKDTKQNIEEIAKFYPNISYIDDNGSQKSDIMNKYFLMFQNEASESLYKQIEEERKWRAWADNHLVHLISPNVYRSSKEALETFEWFSEIGEWSENFPKWERNLMVYMGAGAMFLISKRLKKRHHLTDDVRSHLYDACNKWMTELDIKNAAFMGGKEPNLADLATFGVLNSMEGCQAFIDCLNNTNIGKWFYAVKMHVAENRGEILNSNNYA